MKIYRVLYTPDDTAFMIYAESKEQALEKAIKKNIDELEYPDDADNLKDYLIDEFTPETNNTGILTFWDVFTVFPRNCTPYLHITNKQIDKIKDVYESNKQTLNDIKDCMNGHNSFSCIEDSNGFFEQGYNNAMEFVFKTLGIDFK